MMYPHNQSVARCNKWFGKCQDLRHPLLSKGYMVYKSNNLRRQYDLITTYKYHLLCIGQSLDQIPR